MLGPTHFQGRRNRIHLTLTSPSRINEAALRFKLLQLPGIQDVVFKPFASGTGSGMAKVSA